MDNTQKHEQTDKEMLYISEKLESKGYKEIDRVDSLGLIDNMYFEGKGILISLTRRHSGNGNILLLRYELKDNFERWSNATYENVLFQKEDIDYLVSKIELCNKEFNKDFLEEVISRYLYHYVDKDNFLMALAKYSGGKEYRYIDTLSHVDGYKDKFIELFEDEYDFGNFEIVSKEVDDDCKYGTNVYRVYFNSELGKYIKVSMHQGTNKYRDIDSASFKFVYPKEIKTVIYVDK